eukprot:6209440-Pleurochrysis_carterae.AAC.4
MTRTPVRQAGFVVVGGGATARPLCACLGLGSGERRVHHVHADERQRRRLSCGGTREACSMTARAVQVEGGRGEAPRSRARRAPVEAHLDVRLAENTSQIRTNDDFSKRGSELGVG